MRISIQSPSFLFAISLLNAWLVSAQQVSVVTVQAPRPTHEPSFVDDADFIASVLNSTNLYRYEHGVPPLAWNNSLQTYAQNWTEACVFAHSGGPSGENLAEGYNTVALSIDAWGDERSQYNFDAQGFSEATGHFTQLVWSTTRTVGCGRKLCQTGVGGWYLVCEYWPAGNVIGSFSEHVFRQANDGQGFQFQNCTMTGNCTALPAGVDSGGDGSGNGGGSSGGSGSGSGSGSGGRAHGGGGEKNDGSNVYIGPMMALIVITASGLSLIEPWQVWHGEL